MRRLSYVQHNPTPARPLVDKSTSSSSQGAQAEQQARNTYRTAQAAQANVRTTQHAQDIQQTAYARRNAQRAAQAVPSSSSSSQAVHNGSVTVREGRRVAHRGHSMTRSGSGHSASRATRTPGRTIKGSTRTIKRPSAPSRQRNIRYAPPLRQRRRHDKLPKPCAKWRFRRPRRFRQRSE